MTTTLHPTSRAMLRTSLAAIALACTGAWAQTAALAPVAARTDDRTIQQDHATYERLQARIAALNAGGRRLGDYPLAKAQCWLDASFHEYTRNDRGPFPQAALAESEKLIVAMEQKAQPIPAETARIADAAELRPDLWQRTLALKGKPGFTCAAARTACAEVELVHAGNEINQQQWRHARPYLQMAEDMIVDAEASAASCTAKP